MGIQRRKLAFGLALLLFIDFTYGHIFQLQTAQGEQKTHNLKPINFRKSISFTPAGSQSSQVTSSQSQTIGVATVQKTTRRPMQQATGNHDEQAAEDSQSSAEVSESVTYNKTTSDVNPNNIASNKFPVSSIINRPSGSMSSSSTVSGSYQQVTYDPGSPPSYQPTNGMHPTNGGQRPNRGVHGGNGRPTGAQMYPESPPYQQGGQDTQYYYGPSRLPGRYPAQRPNAGMQDYYDTSEVGQSNYQGLVPRQPFIGSGTYQGRPLGGQGNTAAMQQTGSSYEDETAITFPDSPDGQKYSERCRRSKANWT